mmetsp:Transcript_14389/g.23459  ORF Transcript_14389/g.23459 Transcript_14389/m.23459 type:complete len:207 (+) Transcript_14389:771-1391(+)
MPREDVPDDILRVDELSQQRVTARVHEDVNRPPPLALRLELRRIVGDQHAGPAERLDAPIRRRQAELLQPCPRAPQHLVEVPAHRVIEQGLEGLLREEEARQPPLKRLALAVEFEYGEAKVLATLSDPHRPTLPIDGGCCVGGVRSNGRVAAIIVGVVLVALHDRFERLLPLFADDGSNGLLLARDETSASSSSPLIRGPRSVRVP